MKYRLLTLDPEALPDEVLAEVPEPASRSDLHLFRFDKESDQILVGIAAGLNVKNILERSPLSRGETLSRLVTLYDAKVISFSPSFSIRFMSHAEDAGSSAAGEMIDDGPRGGAVDAVPILDDVPPPLEDLPPQAPEESNPSVAEEAPVAEPTDGVEAAPDQAPAAGETAEAPVEASAETPAEMSAEMPVEAPAESLAPPAVLPQGETVTGSLDDKPIIDLLEEFIRNKFTGTCAFKDSHGSILIYFEGGHPAYFTSNRPSDDLGTLLYKAKKLDPRKYEIYKKALRDTESDPEKALVTNHLLDRSKLRVLRVWRARSLIENLLSWPTGEYAVTPGGGTPQNLQRTKINIVTLLASSWRKLALTDRKKEFINNHLIFYIFPTASFDTIIENMNLEDRELKLIDGIRSKVLSVRKVFTISTIYSSQTYLLLDRLINSGAVELKEDDPSAMGPVDVDKLKSLADSMAALNFFERLSAHPASTPSEMEQHYRDAKDRFDIKAYQHLSKEQIGYLEKMNRLADEAYQALDTDEKRRAYRKDQYSPMQLGMFADIQLQKGIVILTLRSNVEEAISLLSSAYDLLPNNAECVIHLADAYFRQRKAKEARALIEKARTLPLAAHLMAYLATLYYRMGNLGAARQLAVKAYAQAPKDGRVREYLNDIPDIDYKHGED